MRYEAHIKAGLFAGPPPLMRTQGSTGLPRIREGDTEHELDAGDCLQLGSPAPCSFINPTRETCRYLVALTKRHA